ncbi:MAG: hypothetical protein ACOVQA_07080 [Thermoflexibacteraceae bacterium]
MPMILRIFTFFVLITLYSTQLFAQNPADKTIQKSLDSLQDHIKSASELLTKYGDSIQSKLFVDKSLAQEYMDAMAKVKTASWKSYAEQVMAESMLLPAFSGQKELMGALLKVAKNNKLDAIGVRNKLTKEVLKYDIVALLNETNPKYANILTAKKASNTPAAPQMTETEAVDAKTAAMNIATTKLETYMQRHRLDNPRLSLEEWRKFWTELLKDKTAKEVVLRGQQGLIAHPKLVEKEKTGSNMRDAFTALMQLQH